MIGAKKAVETMKRAKERYELAQAWRKSDIVNGRAITIDELSAVANIASVGIVPDGSFSDAACDAWCIICRIMAR